MEVTALPVPPRTARREVWLEKLAERRQRGLTGHRHPIAADHG